MIGEFLKMGALAMGLEKSIMDNRSCFGIATMGTWFRSQRCFLRRLYAGRAMCAPYGANKINIRLSDSNNLRELGYTCDRNTRCRG